MGLGVLEARDEHVPGTTWVFEDESRSENLRSQELKTGARGLKFDYSGKEPIILVPQPSDDPNDPLNWPLWKRDVILALLCLYSVIATTLSPLLAADSITLLSVYRNGLQNIALLTGWHLVGVGVAGFIFVASARIWGKRHLYLLGCILIIVSTAWGGSSGRNYTSMVWARVIQGVGLAPFEALVNSSVGDLYCVHQRGTRMALSNMALFGGAFFTPILVGVITRNMGWEWTFYFVSIFSGAFFPVLFFFVPETAFRRPDSLNTDMIGDTTHTPESTTPPNGASSNTAVDQPMIVPEKVSYWQTLLPFNGRKTDENFFKLIVRPLPLFLHPGILWACLTQGVLIGWTVMIGVVVAAIFFGPPLWFTEQETGYIYTGPFVGAVLGFLLSGLLSDWSTKLMIKRNKGVYEPEFRIVLVIPQLICGTIGLFGFGVVSSNITEPFVPAMFFGFVVAAMVLGAVASALYIVDAHREISVEGFTCMLIFKNIFSFGITYGAFDWIVERGQRDIFMIMGGLQVGICLLSVPMYMFGKRNRALMQRYDLLKILRLR